MKLPKLPQLKVLITLMIIGLVFISPSFANGDTPIDDKSNFLGTIVLFLAWSWSIFAIIAGKLMTNDIIVGGMFNLDVYLWKMWNVMKNFANFALGLTFLFYVIKSLVSKEDDSRALITKKLKGFLLAGILIQASRFLTMAMLDISTIMTSAVGSMPSIFIGDNQAVKDDFRAKSANIKGKKLRYATNQQNGKMEMTIVDMPGEISDDELMDSIMPKSTSMSGPLMFLGQSILNLHYSTMRDPAASTTGKGLLFTILINFSVILMYSVALIVLAVVNVVRVGFIWVLIAGGPIFALLWGLQRGGVFKEDILKEDKLKPATLIELIFLPVRVVAFLSVILILITTMQSMLVRDDTQIKIDEAYQVEVKKLDDKSIFHIDGVVDQSYDGDIFQNTITGGKNLFADLIVFIFTIMMMWILIKFSFPSDNAITKKITDFAFKNISDYMASAPIIPLPGGGASISVDNIDDLFDRGSDKLIQSYFGEGATMSDLDRPGTDKFRKHVQQKWLGMPKPTSLDGVQTKQLKYVTSTSVTDPTLFINKVHEIAPKIHNGFSISDPQRVPFIDEWLKNHGKMTNIGGLTFSSYTYNPKKTDADNIKEYFISPLNAKNFHTLLKKGGLFPLYSSGDNYESLYKNKYTGTKVQDDNAKEAEDKKVK